MRRGIFRFHPLLWALIPVVGGIAGSYLFAIPFFVSIIVALFSLLTMAVSHLRLNRYYGERLSVICFVCSVFLFFGSIAAYRTGQVLYDTHTISLPEDTYRVELLQPFTQKQGWRAVEARLISSESGGIMDRKPKVLLILQGNPHSKDSPLTGSCMDIHTSFAPILPEKDPFAPDLSTYYRSRKVVARAFADTLHWQRSECAIHTSWITRIRNIQFHLANSIDQKIENQLASSLMQAMLLGYKSDLMPQTKAEFRASGLSHILAVSGLHVGIVALLIGCILFFIPATPSLRWVKWVLSVLMVLGYGALTGFSVSVVRASLLFVVLQTGYYLHLQRNTLNILFMIALLQLAYNPLLLFDIGFQLSYVAVGAIVWMSPKIDVLLSDFSRLNQRVLSLLCVTLEVQLALLPLLLLHFHQFPLGFLFANLLVLPFLPWVMGGGFVWLWAVEIGFECTEFSRVVECAFVGIGKVASGIGQYQPDGWNRLWISPLTSLFLIVLGLVFYFYLRKRKAASRWALALVVSLTLISVVTTHFERSRYQRIALYSVGKSSVLHLVAHSVSAVIPMEGPIDQKLLNGRLDGVLSYKSIDSTRTIQSPHLSRSFRYQSPILEACGKVIYIADSTVLIDQFPKRPLDVDYLIVTSTFRFPIRFLEKWCSPKTVICTARLPQWRLEERFVHALFSSSHWVYLERGGSFIEPF